MPLALENRAHSRGNQQAGHGQVNAAIATIPIAMIACIMLLPADATIPGALMAPAWLLTIGILGGLLVDITRKGPAQIICAQHVLALGMVIVIYPELLQDFYSSALDSRSIEKTFLAIGLFSWTTAFGSCLPPVKPPAKLLKLACTDYSPKWIFRLSILCWLLFMLNIAIAAGFSPAAILKGVLSNRWEAPWARGSLGSWDAFRDFLNNFGYILPTLTTMLALKLRSWWRTRVQVSLGLSACTLAFVAQTGGRRLIVVMLGAALLSWLCARRKALRIRDYVMIGVLVLATAGFLELILAVRNTGVSAESASSADFTGVHVDDNFRSLGETLRIVPAQVDYVGFRQIWYVLVRPIPRVFWESKPTSSGFDLAEQLGASNVAFAITVVGELYISFGWFGIAGGGLLFGWAATSWNHLSGRSDGVVSAALYGLGAMALFLGLRSLLELVLMCYPILCWLAIDGVLHARPSRRPSEQRWIPRESRT